MHWRHPPSPRAQASIAGLVPVSDPQPAARERIRCHPSKGSYLAESLPKYLYGGKTAPGELGRKDQLGLPELRQEPARVHGAWGPSCQRLSLRPSRPPNPLIAVTILANYTATAAMMRLPRAVAFIPYGNCDTHSILSCLGDLAPPSLSGFVFVPLAARHTRCFLCVSTENACMMCNANNSHFMTACGSRVCTHSAACGRCRGLSG